MDAHPDDGFTRLALPLHMAWAAARLSGVARAVLDVLAIDCWAMGRRGYVSELRPLHIAGRIGASKRQVNDAVRDLVAKGFVRRVPGGRLELVPRVPEDLVEQVQAWYRRTLGGNPPTRRPESSRVGGNPPTPERETAHPDDPVGGKPPEVGGKPPSRLKKERAREDQINYLTSSSINPEFEKADDDGFEQQPPKELVGRWLKGLLPELARAIAGQTRTNREETLEKLLSVQGPPYGLAKAAAALLTAIEAQGFQVRQSPAGVLVHALKNPNEYPHADPGEVLAKLIRQRQQSGAKVAGWKPGGT